MGQDNQPQEKKQEKPKIETIKTKPPMSIFENETENRLIDIQSEEVMDSTMKEIEEYMATNSGNGKSEIEKDNLYAYAKGLWEKYATVLRNTKFSFYLNRKQYNYLTELLRNKLEYDVNTIFLAIELSGMLGNWVQIGPSKSDDEVRSYECDATDITYIYHLISKHTVKGLSHATYTFGEILRKIGDISKIINYYDTNAKALSQDIMDWVASFEDGVTLEKTELAEEALKDLLNKKQDESKDEPVETKTE